MSFVAYFDAQIPLEVQLRTQTVNRAVRLLRQAMGALRCFLYIHVSVRI